jgi:hypothetical protein
MPDLEKLLERLIQHDVEFVLIEGYAAMMHGVPNATFDVDVCSPMHRQNIEKVHAALADLEPVHRETPHIPFQVRDGFKNCYLSTTLGKLALLGLVSGVGDYTAAAARSIEMELPFGKFRVLDCESLIAAKLSAGREKDLLVVKQLRAMQESGNPPEHQP